MNTNLKLLPTSTVENKLCKMKELSQQLKEIQAYYDLLKSEVISEYFATNEEYRTSKGLLLASYKCTEVKRFQQTKFRESFPDYFEMFSEAKPEFKFLLK